MNKHNFFGNAALVIGLLAASSSFADETSAPVRVSEQERATYLTQARENAATEQRAEMKQEMQQKMAQHRHEVRQQDGQGEQHRNRLEHRETARAQAGTGAMHSTGGGSRGRGR